MKTSALERSLLTLVMVLHLSLVMLNNIGDGTQRLSNEQMGIWCFGGNFGGVLM